MRRRSELTAARASEMGFCSPFTPKVEKAGDEMIKAYAKICAMLECVPDNGYEDFWWKKAESLKHQAESLQAAYLDPAGSGNSSYFPYCTESTASITAWNWE